jgi:hypothetical protein
MRANITSGSVFQGLTIIGTGAAVILPDQKWIGALIIAVGVLSLIFDVKLERGHLEVGSPRSFWKRLWGMSGQVLMLIGGLVFIVGALWTFWPSSKPAPAVFVPNAMGAWASDKEIQAFRKRQRDLVPYSPDLLANMYFSAGDSAIAVYKDKWVKISHTFVRLLRSPNDSVVVEFSGMWPYMQATFNPLEWEQKLTPFTAGQTINAACKVNVEREGADQTSRVIFKGYDCELVDWD